MITPGIAGDPVLLAVELTRISVAVARIAVTGLEDDLAAYRTAATLDEIEETAETIAQEFGTYTPAPRHLSVVGK